MNGRRVDTRAQRDRDDPGERLGLRRRATARLAHLGEDLAHPLLVPVHGDIQVAATGLDLLGAAHGDRRSRARLEAPRSGRRLLGDRTFAASAGREDLAFLAAVTVDRDAFGAMAWVRRDGSVDLFVVDAEGSLLHSQRTADGWSAWATIAADVSGCLESLGPPPETDGGAGGAGAGGAPGEAVDPRHRGQQRGGRLRVPRWGRSGRRRPGARGWSLVGIAAWVVRRTRRPRSAVPSRAAELGRRGHQRRGAAACTRSDGTSRSARVACAHGRHHLDPRHPDRHRAARPRPRGVRSVPAICLGRYWPSGTAG